ncbi:MAG TPA: two-component regulator propeller domain-containing protein [Prolixibacteraceae bacterium]|nr:two-component regulator propeller domain-containing protein [Prolixibacteraceae bacterium]
MIKKLQFSVCLTILLLFTYANSVAQQGNMVAYIATQWITGFAEEGGYLWNATHGGLTKFDKASGSVVETYNTFNSDIPTNYLNSIAIDKDGNKWMGSDIGIIKFTGDSWEYYTNAELGLEATRINTVAVDTAGNVWAANYFDVIINDGSGWTLFDDSGIGFNLSGISQIVTDKLGNVWFTHELYNIDKFDGEQWTRYSDFGKFPTLAVDDDGNAWVMGEYHLYKIVGLSLIEFPNAYNSGLGSNVIDCGPGNLVWCSYGGDDISSFDGSEWTKYSLPDFPENVDDIIASDDGRVWFGTSNGLYKFEDGILSRYAASDVAFYNNYIQDIEIEPGGKKWIIDGNVSSFDGEWEFHWSNGFLNKSKMDMDGNLWLGGIDGVYILDSTLDDPFMAGCYIRDISMGPSGEMCFASGFISSGPLGIFKDSQWSIYNGNNSLISGDVSCAAFDDNGTVWFGDSNGLHTFDGFNWSTYSTYNSGIPFNLISCMAFNNAGIKYFGSYSKGVARFDGTSWTHITKSNSPLTDNQISCLKFDEQGYLWIGTQDSGLFCTNGEQWWALNMPNSALPHNNITDIEFEGNLKWIGTEQGLVSYDGTGELLEYTPIGLKDKLSYTEQINIYPNPANDKIKADIPTEPAYNVTIINNQGITLQSYLNTSTTLNIQSLAPGFYYIRITTDRNSYIGKFIKL